MSEGAARAAMLAGALAVATARVLVVAVVVTDVEFVDVAVFFVAVVLVCVCAFLAVEAFVGNFVVDERHRDGDNVGAADTMFDTSGIKKKNLNLTYYLNKRLHL